MGEDSKAQGAIPAVVLAGGRISGRYAHAVGTRVKALARVLGSPVILHVVDALQGAPGIDRICVVGPEAVREILGDRCLWQRETDSALGNLRAGIERLNPCDRQRLLICGSDLPAIDTPSVQDFLNRAPPEADVCMPVVRKETFLTTFPGSFGTFVRLAEGAFTAGSQFLVRPRVLRDQTPLLHQLFNRRKSQLGMARTLGAGRVWKLMTRRLTVPEIEACACELTGCHCQAVLDCRAEMAFDIDGLPDLRYAEKWRAERR
jgi:molybdopterin-guanine dinucleotide biosynthesis protein A